ncbi:MAG TPA: hydroxymethylbilane synthase [Alphaproteobacteria bacterium]|nr:hydroxymethylbilane synthase [Alphaproteobacteria bacterium]
MHFRIATRKSKLAQIQANLVGEKLEEIGHSYELVLIVSTGDKSQKTNGDLSKDGGKGAFIKEVQEAVAEGRADIAVHSMKDVPSDFERPEGFVIPAVLERENHRDVVITRKNDTFLMLEKGAKIGTSSIRRASQIRANFPYLDVVHYRGNVDSRIQKMDEGVVDAIILAKAGIDRLGLENRIDEVLESDVMMPAFGQGIIGIECKADATEVIDALKEINHEESFVCLTVERAITNALQGNCHTPMAGYCEYSAGGSLRVVALVSSKDGETVLRSRYKEKGIDPVELGEKVAKDLLSQGAEELIKEASVND